MSFLSLDPTIPRFLVCNFCKGQFVKSITIPLPDPTILESQDGPDSALAIWLKSLDESLRPLAQLKLNNGGEVNVDVRCSADGGYSPIVQDRPFQWNSAESHGHADSNEDGFWVLGIEIDRVNTNDRQLSETEEGDYFSFYLRDFEGEGRVAQAKLALVLEIIMKRLAQPPTGFSSRLADVLTLLRP